MNPKELHVIAVVSNPCRFKSRYALYEDFRQMVNASGATLTTVEMSFGRRSHAVTHECQTDRVVQVQTDHELWHKENLINLGIQALPRDARYIAWVDADVQFSRADWARETIHQLQHHAFVQMFSHAIDLGPEHQPVQTHAGFAFGYAKGMLGGDGADYCGKWHPGYAWAARREALDAVGGLIDFAILGAADKHMAMGLIGCIQNSFRGGRLSSPYVRRLLEWQGRAERHVRRDLGYVPQTLTHFWHGKKRDRRYIERWKLLVDHGYDPDKDLRKDTQGLWRLNDTEDPRHRNLRDALRLYFRQRNEDSIDLL